MNERTTTAIPTGTLTRKIQCQSRTSVRTPPSSTPSDPPPEATKPKTPIAFARSAGSVNSVIISESATADTTAPPMPCTARAPTSISCDVANPHADDASVNSAIPSRNSRRCPNRSPNRPPSRRKPPKVIRYAFTTHASDSSEKLEVLAGSTAARRRRSSRRGRSSGRRGREPEGPASVRGSSCSSSESFRLGHAGTTERDASNSSVGTLRGDARRRDAARPGTRAPPASGVAARLARARTRRGRRRAVARPRRGDRGGARGGIRRGARRAAVPRRRAQEPGAGAPARRRVARGRRAACATTWSTDAPLVTGGRSAGARVACRTAAGDGRRRRALPRVPAVAAAPLRRQAPGEPARGARRGRRRRCSSSRASAIGSGCRPDRRRERW